MASTKTTKSVRGQSSIGVVPMAFDELLRVAAVVAVVCSNTYNINDSTNVLNNVNYFRTGHNH